MPFLSYYDSGAPAASRAAKRNTVTLGTEPHASIEIENHATDFSLSTWLAAWITGAPNDDNDDVVAQRGGYTPPNTKS